MPMGLIGKKIGMTRVFDKDAGVMIPVSVIDVKGNSYVQEKIEEKEGYRAVQIGFGDQKAQRLTQAEAGHFKKHNSAPKKIIKEFRLQEGEEAVDISSEHPGAEMFEDGQYVDVIGTTKGKGFQGVVKRYNFAGQPDSHGHMMHRRTGAIAAGTTPGRVWKNQKMPGRHGVYRRTVQNLKIVQVRAEEQVILISGAVPGHNGGTVLVRPSKKKSNA